MINRDQIGEGTLTEEQEIYRENILDHYKYPRNAGMLNTHTHHRRELNPLCGDELEVFLQVDEERIREVKFQGKGCAISQASMSMLTDTLKNKSLKDTLALTKEDIVNMLGIPIGVVRMKCALLGLKAVHNSLNGAKK